MIFAAVTDNAQSTLIPRVDRLAATEEKSQVRLEERTGH